MADSIVLYEEDVPDAKLTSTKEPSESTVEELKRWFECHSLKKCCRKGDLVERVRLAIDKIKVDPKVDGGKWYQLKKLSIHQITENVGKITLLKMDGSISHQKIFLKTLIMVMCIDRVD